MIPCLLNLTHQHTLYPKEVLVGLLEVASSISCRPSFYRVDNNIVGGIVTTNTSPLEVNAPTIRHSNKSLPFMASIVKSGLGAHDTSRLENAKSCSRMRQNSRQPPITVPKARNLKLHLPDHSIA